ncbi:uncharacterized protein ACA1_384740 [Acanthamoeba castellanii str. Neff]|uniref:Uncharacterized protein n=1 Tax=Acanthamoeba castellanii (strain ATCC 30010 / Neff) TaxID=1257118 RepID=L8HAJ5_ACACF|nr:uncharacterized protein ACA1_384740 [Acanthamoeba castellanii str. Neff]ELR21738.1 hypothetical protein ACA1_384740 [Acanthamoeba castellanii str. Neff]
MPRSPPPLHAQFSSPLSSPPPSLIFGTAPLPPTAGCEPPLDEVWAELREVAPVLSPIVIDASPMTAQAVIIRSDSEESAMSPHVLLSSPAPSPPQSQSSQAPDPPGILYSTDSYSSPLSSPAASPSSSLSDLPSLIAAPLAQHQPRKTVSASPSLASFPPAPGLLDGASSTITSASAPTLPALEPLAYSPSSPAVPLSPASSASVSRSSSVTTSPAATPSTSTTPSPATSPRLPTAAAAPALQPSVGAASSPTAPLKISAPAATPAMPDSLPPATKPSPLVMRVAQASNPPAAGSTTPGSPTPTPGNSKVAALSQSFSAAAATLAGASSTSSGPPLSASTSGGAPSTSSLVQERRKMLFGASAAPSSPMPSPVPQARTGGHANFISQSFAALPSPAVVKPAAPTSVSLKNLPSVQPPKANVNVHSKPTTTPAHSFAALAKTIGHSASSGTAKSSSHPAIPSWVHPSTGGPSSHSAPLSPLHSPATTSPSSSPTSHSPLSTSPQGAASGGTTRKFKEGAPIILSRKNKDGVPARSATFNSPPQATHFDAAMMSSASTTTTSVNAAAAAAGALLPENSPARARRNTSDAPPPSLAAVFVPPTRSVMSTEVADGAMTPTGAAVVKTSSPPATIAKPVVAARGRAKVRTRTPQPLGGGKLSLSTAAAPLPEQQQTAASADEVPVAPTAELAEP